MSTRITRGVYSSQRRKNNITEFGRTSKFLFLNLACQSLNVHSIDPNVGDESSPGALEGLGTRLEVGVVAPHRDQGCGSGPRTHL